MIVLVFVLHLEVFHKLGLKLGLARAIMFYILSLMSPLKITFTRPNERNLAHIYFVIVLC